MKYPLFFVFFVQFFSLEAKIYDCFTFFNELELLKVRFEELYESVDHFVLVEATKTFSGNSKPLYFSENADLFEQYKDKIITIIVDDFPSPTLDPEKDRWVREEFQRNAMLRGLMSCKNEDIILISDLDEIPSKQSISQIRDYFSVHGFYPKENKTNCLEIIEKIENKFICELYMRLFLLYLNREGLVGWNGAVKAAPYWLVKKRSPWSLKILHQYDKNLPKIYNAGWHFHAMGGREQIRYKLESIEPCVTVDEFREWTNRVYNAMTVIVDESYPKYIQEKVSFFQRIGWIAE